MRDLFNLILDVFEERFNVVVEMIALVGSILAILFSIYMFVVLTLGGGYDIMGLISVVIVPGVIAFLAILMLFALRLTRHFTKERKND